MALPDIHQRGDVVGALRIIDVFRRNKRLRYRCVCECGKVWETCGDSVRNKMTVSCGCKRKARGKTFNLKHGHSSHGKRSGEHEAYHGMIQRCHNQNDADYKYYGGRGIVVCCQWMSSFAQFLEDVGHRPSVRHSIDRIDNNGNYEPENVRWADKKQQARNSRNARVITAHGESRCLAEWSEITGIHRSTIKRRLARGMSPGMAIPKLSEVHH